MDTSTLASYDALPYPGDPVAAMHPDRLAVLARLRGLEAASPARCRVLELGCCDGGNLLPLALTFPDSAFVGVDLSRGQIEAGRAEVAALGAGNLDLRHASILDSTTDWGPFDYILCHGVYSWVPAAVRDRILALAGEHLAPAGVAFVSYNVYPGWHAAGTVRQAMLLAGRDATTLADRLACARSALVLLDVGLADDASPHAQQVRAIVEELRGRPDYYLAHEYLDECNEPVWFTDFVARAEAAGLAFLAETGPSADDPVVFGPGVLQALDRLGPDRVAREQGLDLLRNRRFRQTLLCRRDAAVSATADPAALAGLWASSEAQEVEEAEAPVGRVCFAVPDGPSVRSNDAGVVALFRTLEAAWPAAVPVRELAVLPEALLDLVRRGLVEAHVVPPPCGSGGDRPTALPWARHQARRGSRVTDARHRLVELDRTERLLVPLLDGSVDRAGVVARVEELIRQGKIALADGAAPEPEALRAALTKMVAAALRNLARMSLLR